MDLKYNSWFTLSKKIKDFNIEKGLYSFVNPYSMLLLENQLELSENIDFWCVDGISLVNSYNKILKNKINRYSFDDTSVAPIVFDFALKNGLKVGIVATEESFLLKAVKNIEEKYKISISYKRNGFFKDLDERKICQKEIINKEIDIVICGMGTLHQERFLIELKELGWEGYGYTCGGYIHQTAKKNDYYPAFIDKYNLRWLYRMYDEPKLIKRYFISYPVFFLKFFRFKRTLKNTL